MTTASRWIVLLGLQDTKHIRLKIRRIQVDALEWAWEQMVEPFDASDIEDKIKELKGEDHEPV